MLYLQIRGRLATRAVGGEGTGDLEAGAEESTVGGREIGWRLHRGRQSRKRRRRQRRRRRRSSRWLQRRERRLSGAHDWGAGLHSRRKSHLRQSHGTSLSSQGQWTHELEIDSAWFVNTKERERSATRVRKWRLLILTFRLSKLHSRLNDSYTYEWTSFSEAEAQKKILGKKRAQKRIFLYIFKF